MDHIIALDQGTTNTRAVVFDGAGHVVGMAQRELQQLYPHEGWVEHDPLAIREDQFIVARTAIHNAGINGRDLLAIGITNQRETTILWDRRTGEPVSNALVWQDRRTTALCDAIRSEGAEELVRAKTGLTINPYFSASKIRWLLDHIVGLRERAERGDIAFGTVDSWLIWNMTGSTVHTTDATNASRTMLYNIHTDDWDTELLSLWGIPHALLPEICDTSGICASTDFLGAEVPIAGIVGDQQSALFGQACFDPGMAKCTYGTGCFILMATGEKAPVSQHGLLTTVANRSAGTLEYAMEGSVFMGGATIQWLRDGLGIIKDAAEVESLALEVDDSGGVILVPAFTGLGAPYWDPNARGLLIGITRGTTRAHIARAALEALAWQVGEVVRVMGSDAKIILSELRVDGGASANDLLMQYQSDFLSAPIARPHNIECTAYGAALLAGLGVGLFRDRQEIAGKWQAEALFRPRLTDDAVQERRQRWIDAVERSRKWA